MKKRLLLLLNFAFLFLFLKTAIADIVLEPFTYNENFESRQLRAWASYPIWQDTAYDPNFRVNEMVSGDPTNISIVQKVTPYTKVDNYAGAQKLLDMYLVPGSTVSLRYYLKTNLPVEYFKVRIAAGLYGKIDYTINSPVLNRWENITVKFEDFIKENNRLSGKDRIKVNDLAFLAKIPKADPDMPIYLGIDDVVVKGMRAMAFRFNEPSVDKLPEFKPYIAKKHYKKGDTFLINGEWPLNAKKVTLSVVSFTERNKNIFSADLKNNGNKWTAKPLKLTYPEGLYLCTLKASDGKNVLSETEFTFLIAPENIKGRHPRLWFDAEGVKSLKSRLESDKFKKLSDGIAEGAKSWRQRLPVENVTYVADQFPDEDWLPTLGAWRDKTVGGWGSAVKSNAEDYAFHGNRESGEYAVKLLVKIASFPDWNHPWLSKRGRFNYHPTGVMSHEFALAYDLTYDLMTEEEGKIIRKALMDKLVMGSYITYVFGDEVTNDTSNWLAHIVGGALMCMASVYGDGDEEMEPYFTGHIFKMYDFVTKTFNKDGAYGEGYGYNGYTMLTTAQSLPSVENVFKIDLSAQVNGSYLETVWAGIIKNKMNFYFGDSSGDIGSLTDWAWLLPKYKDPLMGWYYNFTKTGDTFWDALYDTENVPKKDPFGDNPVREFRSVGSTIFKSGWEPDDFVFVLRTGPFINHQHIDQGTFWLADKGVKFIEERHGSTYYDDPIYQPWYTQPVAHSTILVNNNHQSQRTGDPLDFADGFDDHAFVGDFLDGTYSSFVEGDIGKLYWGDVKSLKRNVLYIKPRTLIMLDTVVPAEKDADITLLYQTKCLKDITVDNSVSKITVDGKTLYIDHLYPENVSVKAVETPHYLYTLQSSNPLIKEGMLTLTARTSGKPLVIANLLTTEPAGESPKINKGNGFVSGNSGGTFFAFSTLPGLDYETGGVKTDAMAFTQKDNVIFAGYCFRLYSGGTKIFSSESPATVEYTGSTLKYYHKLACKAAIGVSSKPSSLTLNGVKVKDFEYNAPEKTIKLILPEGEGVLSFK